jgi:hypothetical protein
VAIVGACRRGDDDPEGRGERPGAPREGVARRADERLRAALNDLFNAMAERKGEQPPS